IDHRSYKDQGVGLEPTSHMGRAVDEMRARGEQPERFRQLEQVRDRNARRIEQRPEVVFDNLIRRQSTFTRRDIAGEVFRYIDDGEQFRNRMARLEASPELVVLGAVGLGPEEIRYTTRSMLRVEERMAEIAFEMAAADRHPVGEAAFASGISKHPELSSEQREAVRQMTRARNIEVLAGLAGTGKSAAVAVAKDAWEASGDRVRGSALSGIAAENLQKSSGVESRTLASWELAWKNGRERVSTGDVFVIDEAGMLGSRQMARVLARLHGAGAKAVPIGDTAQLQPIEAGAAFRAIAERTGYQELTAIRRQQAQWQREASRDFARGNAGAALVSYQEHGAIRFTATREQAKDRLIGDWAHQRDSQPEKRSLILAHTRADVAELNQRARAVLKQRGELEPEVKVETSREVTRDDGSLAIERGERVFAAGDRVMFLKNDRELGVKNGSLGMVISFNADSVEVILDEKKERQVSFELRNYAAIDHGYAATVHKAQGGTVDRAFVLATPGMDRHLSYVGMTRHREDARLYVGNDDFKDFEALKERLSRARPKDTALDYAQRRGLERAAQPNERQADRIGQPEVDPIERFKRAQREFIKVAGRFDLDREAKARAAELRQEMKWAADEISRSAGLMREAERAGIGGQVRSLNRENQPVMSKEKGFEMER
ncbi:MAG TPA: Ti-type conjugative transfer relaxase TraA, partial [Candidatus Binataceae bacterium]